METNHHGFLRHSSKYKGVLHQPNGRWGAQIYEKQQRLWLGTFNEEDEAARAYDVAAKRFRGHNAAVYNFKPIDDEAEAVFLESHSKDDLADMLRNHTYSDELAQFKKSIEDRSGSVDGASGCGRAREDLFEKALTPSDVANLNRLVVPKQYAEKHFPPLNKGVVLLNFEDAGGKVWRIRYLYWKGSNNYVLTKGWSRFVKENNLKAGDTVCFRRSTGPDKKLYIDFKRRGSGPVRLFGVNISHAIGVDSGCGESSHCGGRNNKRVGDQMNKLSL